jgi:hypothetical protein
MEALAHVQAGCTNTYSCLGLLSSPYDLTHLLRLSPNQALITNFMQAQPAPEADFELGIRPGINVDSQMAGEHSTNATIDAGPDFNESANQLWSLYAKVAEKEDQAVLDHITKDMDNLLLFVRSLFSLYLV